MDNEAYTSDQLRDIAEGLDNANSGCERLAKLFYKAVQVDKERQARKAERPFRCKKQGCGRRFKNQQALDQHKADSHSEPRLKQSFEDAMAILPDDLPDGAFFAMASEIAGVEYGDWHED